MTNTILNVAGYRFVELNELTALQDTLRGLCLVQQLKGTILLSKEGININLAGTQDAVTALRAQLEQDERLRGMRFHEFYSAMQPFKRLKIKIKKEIITFRKPDMLATSERAPALPPEELKRWLDEGRDMVLLDTRNDYEVEYGTFNGAVNLHLQHFTDLPAAVSNLTHDKPIVMFCTGGIRCEKAALYLKDQGYQEVYQLDGGILGYFNKVGGIHYNGGCFVFDERIAVEPQ